MKNKVFLILTIVVIFGSCGDFLNIDNYFSDELKIDSVFSEKRYVEAYLWAITREFTDEGALLTNSYTPGPLATDEAFTVMLTSNGFNGMRFVLGEISASNLYTLNQWAPMYRVIRKCNTLLSRIDEAKDLTDPIEKFRIIANARFMRAYAYYTILINHGPPILLGDDVIENNEPLEFYNRGRCTYDEAVEYIISELEWAANYLYPVHPSVITDFGKPTQGAAYGLIARLRLYHASPLFNGGDIARRVFGTWKRSSDDVYYVSVEEYDEERWALAAAAAKRVMDMGLYRLHTVPAGTDTKTIPTGVTDPDFYKQWPEGAAGIDHFRSYAEMFNGETVAQTNPEFVWARLSTTLTNNAGLYFPVSNNGSNGISVTQKVIDNFRMFDGRTISEANEPSAPYPYSETGFSTPQGFSGYRFTDRIHNMYVNREMRFYASIGFNRCYWYFESTTSPMINIIEYTSDGNNGKYISANQLNFPPTGYVIKKFVNPLDSRAGDNARTVMKPYAMIRYADILLMYAEALNNLTRSHSVEVNGEPQVFFRDPVEIKRAFNQVRYRAGLPGITGDESRDELQALIEQERMIELLFENHRYFDVRRWGIYEETESIPVTGMNTEGAGDSFYRRVVPNTPRIGARIVHRRLHLVPLPLSEVRLLPLLDQNPGWEE